MMHHFDTEVAGKSRVRLFLSSLCPLCLRGEHSALTARRILPSRSNRLARRAFALFARSTGRVLSTAALSAGGHGRPPVAGAESPSFPRTSGEQPHSPSAPEAHLDDLGTIATDFGFTAVPWF